jgi:hypothetical protein
VNVHNSFAGSYTVLTILLRKYRGQQYAVTLSKVPLAAAERRTQVSYQVSGTGHLGYANKSPDPAPPSAHKPESQDRIPRTMAQFFNQKK